MQIRKRIAKRGKFSANLLGHRISNRDASFRENARHDAAEEPLPDERRQPIDRPDRFRISVREPMHFRLVNLDLIFASGVRDRRDAPAHEHALSARKITTHVCGQVEPHEPNPPALRVEPSAGEPSPARAAHRPLDDLAEVAFDDRHHSRPQIVGRGAFAPILVSSREMEDQIVCGDDAARFQSHRTLRADSRELVNPTRDLKRFRAALFFAHRLRREAHASRDGNPAARALRTDEFSRPRFPEPPRSHPPSS